MKKVSIIVPVYNVENYLSKCIESLLRQTLNDIEIILVNDGSFDKSKEICEDYLSKDNRIVLINKLNGGQSSARNEGLKLANGEFVMFVDSDDLISDNMCEVLYGLAIKYNLDIVCCNDTSNLLALNHSMQPQNLEIINDGILKRYFEKGSVSCWGKLYKATLLENFTFEQGKISEDVMATYILMSRAHKIAYIANQFYYYNQESFSTCRSPLQKRDFYAIEATSNVCHMCKGDQSYEMAQLHVYKAMFNIINKSVINGFENSATEEILLNNLPHYVKNMRENLPIILSSKYFYNYDKIQITMLCISYNLFKKVKGNKFVNKLLKM